ncbi:MAG: hypothetical protein LBR64_07795 [Dysgonamonadaceae bacterium]|jgi:hypothetical protein|nr:hypothetical protein [Dysgonamonadaceae bacterium]
MLRKLVFLLLAAFLSACSQKESKQNSFEQGIKAGIAKVTGQVVNYPPQCDSTISMYVEYPVTAELKLYSAKIKEDGGFYFEIPLECNYITVIDMDSHRLPGVCLVPNAETKIKVEFSDEGEMKINMESPLDFISEDYDKNS